uniref:Reverse transcriptase domain-containing protein n=1 Tax=Cyprinus carpio TaxID=7962 RepID=A0A8C1S6N0_CYPCA
MFFSVLNETCPPGYCYLQKARSTGRGGGLAVIHRSDLILSPITLPELSSFECLAFKCKHPLSTMVFLIYWPPKPNSSFIPEMSNLLSTFCTMSANIIILGDMNIHVNSSTCRFAAEFLQLLDCFNLTQLVDSPTHTRGHTLDLVITNSVYLSNLLVYDLGVSDHKDISMKMSSLSSFIKPKRFKSTGLTVHKLAFREHQKDYSKSLMEARSNFYSNVIRNSPGNSKQLFSTINHLLKPQTPSLTETTEEHCNNFLDFFKTKIDSIYSTFSESSPLSTLTIHLQPVILEPLHRFPEISQQEVETIIKRMKPTTCALDPFPTVLVKVNTSVLSPLITTIINHSLQSGIVPSALKSAMIRPLLKKPTLDPDVLANYRPISNLPFLSKVLEKVVVSHLQDHLKHNNLFEKFQSGFRTAHSTETALVRVTNDLRMTADAGSPSLLILLDLSAAFDTVDHGILLNRLHHTIGLTGTALNWFKSYLTNRTEYISLGSARSRQHTVTLGVPQGSVLGPILFIIYMIPLGHVISRYGVSFHCYADDTQLYMKTSPTSFSSSTLTACLEEIRVWMKHNFLQLNSSKTEAILVGTPRQTQSSSITGITITDHVISLSTTVTNLGVRFDPQLSFEAHIKNLCKTSFYHLRNIAKLRPMLTLADAEKLVHAFVSSRLDYCNALLIGIPNKSLQRLQYVQNSAARILMRVRKYDHITPILHSLHWLPVSARIEYKISLLTYQCIYGNAPPYLKELLTPSTTSRSLHSTNLNRLLLPKTKLSTMGDRAFCSAAHRIWNALPDHPRAPQTIETFKKGLKHLFLGELMTFNY